MKKVILALTIGLVIGLSLNTQAENNKVLTDKYVATANADGTTTYKVKPKWNQVLQQMLVLPGPIEEAKAEVTNVKTEYWTLQHYYAKKLHYMVFLQDLYRALNGDWGDIKNPQTVEELQGRLDAVAMEQYAKRENYTFFKTLLFEIKADLITPERLKNAESTVMLLLDHEFTKENEDLKLTFK